MLELKQIKKSYDEPTGALDSKNKYSDYGFIKCDCWK